MPIEEIVTPGTHDKPNFFYRPELDALRFFAAFLVIQNHTLPKSPFLLFRNAGMFGVPIFLVLSSYLITGLLLRERDYSHTIDLRRFYIRRILRIWPLYLLLLFTAFFLGLIARKIFMPVPELLSYLFFVGNWYAVTHYYLPFLGVLWTINVEEQFYLVWPLILRYASGRIVLILSILIWVGCQIAGIVLGLRHVLFHPVVWPNSLVQFQYFALGAILYIATRGRPAAYSAMTRFGLFLIGLALLIGAASFIEDHFTVQMSFAMGTVGLGSILIFQSFSGSRLMPKAKPLVYFGKISYGIYTLHFIVIIVLDNLSRMAHLTERGQTALVYWLTPPLAVAVAALSYRFFETPFLRLKSRFEVVHSRPV
jgi:peptidoglycan/LPS O-acetylase OafA/YrhL